MPFPATDKKKKKVIKESIYFVVVVAVVLQWVCHDSSVPSVTPYLVHELLRTCFLKCSVMEEIIK